MTSPALNSSSKPEKILSDLNWMLGTQLVAFTGACFAVVAFTACGWFPWQLQTDGWKTLASLLSFDLLLVTLTGMCVAVGLKFTSWRERAIAGGPQFVEATLVSYIMMMLAIAGAIGRAVAALLTNPAAAKAISNLAESELALGAIGFAIFKLTVLKLPKASSGKDA